MDKPEFNETELRQIKDVQQNIIDCLHRQLLAGYRKEVVGEALVQMMMHPEKFFK